MADACAAIVAEIMTSMNGGAKNYRKAFIDDYRLKWKIVLLTEVLK
jgi:hypothetical protein